MRSIHVPGGEFRVRGKTTRIADFYLNQFEFLFLDTENVSLQAKQISRAMERPVDSVVLTIMSGSDL